MIFGPARWSLWPLAQVCPKTVHVALAFSPVDHTDSKLGWKVMPGQGGNEGFDLGCPGGGLLSLGSTFGLDTL